MRIASATTQSEQSYKVRCVCDACVVQEFKLYGQSGNQTDDEGRRELLAVQGLRQLANRHGLGQNGIQF